MSAIFLAVFGLLSFFLGYRFYSKFIAEKIYQLDPDFETPSHSMRDDTDYVPTNKVVLWGHHFTAVAGAAPIIGPAIAIIWGWLPAFIWVAVGTVFFAGVHDLGAIWVSVRNKARSVGSITGDVVGLRARNLFLVVIFLLLLMVNAVFAVAIAEAFLATPSSVIAVWAAVPLAVIVGFAIYKFGVPVSWATGLSTIILYVAVYLGDIFPVELPERVLGLQPGPMWILILFLYALIASLLPVWCMLQPRGAINGIQLFVGLGLLYGAILLANPTVVAPAINLHTPAGSPPIFPLLFVTIACGAISGFHGLVASGTTSKQLDRETDARGVGYLGSVGEGSLALATIIATSAGFASLSDWEMTYSTFGSGGIAGFAAGGAKIVTDGLGIPFAFGVTLLTVMAILFASTTMDAGVRLQRYIIQEWGVIYNIPALRNGHFAAFAAVAACLALAFGAGGAEGRGGMIIWPLFGTTNQLLAGLTLLLISVILVKLGRPSKYTMVPMVFVTVTSFLSALYQLWDLYRSGNYLLVGIDFLIIVAAIFVMLEATSTFLREKRASAAAVSASAE